ncbi:MAG: hypothetical protein PHU42_02640 [Patescibacteria group bacterium]|nr:hypothetical protein [Patescibacteria group bacterium]
MTDQSTDEEKNDQASAGEQELTKKAQALADELREKNEAFNKKCGTLVYELNRDLDKANLFLDEKEKEFEVFEGEKKKELKEAEEKYDIPLSDSEKEAYDLEDEAVEEAPVAEEAV